MICRGIGENQGIQDRNDFLIKKHQNQQELTGVSKSLWKQKCIKRWRFC